MAVNRSKGTITLTWSMDDESWSHWAQGRGKKTEQAIVLEGLNKIRKSPEARKEIKSLCERIREGQESIGQSTQEGEQPRNRIEIQLPAADWGEAFQLVGTPGNPVNPGHLLAAVILESETWKQSGNDDAEYNAGWSQDQLISSIAGSTKLTHTKRVSLGQQGKLIAWIVAIAAVATAVAAWLALY